MIVKMYELVAQEDPLGVRATCFSFVALSRYGGFRQQEFAMDTKKQIKYYVLPDGKTVVRAFTVKKIIFFDEDRTRIIRPLQEQDLSQKFGTKYGVQKNQMNGQIILYANARGTAQSCWV